MATTPGTEIIELETGVFARLHEGLTNAGIIVGDDGVLVIDSLRVPSFGRELIHDVRHITDKPIRYLVDTHSHWDHAWGNEEFPDATIIGHENCYEEMVDVEWNRQWREKVMSSGDPWSEEAGLVNITPPNLTFETSMRLYIGREVRLLFLGRAHTGGDTHIYLPDDGILFCGDVAQDGGMPFLADSYPSEWPATDDKLVELNAPRFVVPGTARWASTPRWWRRGISSTPWLAHSRRRRRRAGAPRTRRPRRWPRWPRSTAGGAASSGWRRRCRRRMAGWGEGVYPLSQDRGEG